MEKFTYYDYMYCIRNKLLDNKESNFILREDSIEYKLEDKKKNHPYDKTFRMILNDKEEAAAFINKTLRLKKNRLKSEDIEKYSTRFITSEFENSESDIVYRKKGTSIFFLIEHQSKVDYSMPYRILTYNMEIMKSALRENLLNTKGYKLPIVYPMVLYTGKKKWSAKKYLEQCQEHLEECDVKTFTYYHLIDINQCKEQELLEENNFLSKILLLEKMKTTDKLEENLQKIMKSNLSKKERQMLSKIVYYNLITKIGEEKAIYYAKKILCKEEKRMSVLDDYICSIIDREMEKGEKRLQQMKKELQQGEKELQQGKKELQQGKKELQQGKKELQQGKKELQQGKKELQQGEKELQQEEMRLQQEEVRLQQEREKLMKQGGQEKIQHIVIEMIRNNIDEKTIKIVTKVSQDELQEIKEGARFN